MHYFIIKWGIALFMTITVGPYASTESSMYQIFNTDFKAHNKRDGVEDKLKSEKCSYLEPDTQNDPCSHPIVKEVLLTNHLNELRLQDEKHIRKKKSVLQQEKTYRTMKMRKKLKQLMSNIAETLNDIDQYFGADQLYGKINDQGFVQGIKSERNCEAEAFQALDEESENLLLDSFIQEMFEVNPLIIDKLKSRIDKQFSSSKNIRLAQQMRHFEKGKRHATSNSNVSAATSKPSRKVHVKSVVIKKTVPDYNEKDKSLYDSLVNTQEKCDFVDNDNKASESILCPDQVHTSSSTPSTTVETFYDYGDYYRDNDYGDISDYDINREDVEYSTLDREESHNKHFGKN